MIFKKKGILTTLQDTKRTGFAVHGILPSGPMDEFSVRVANILLGNPSEEACLEIHFPGPILAMEEDGIYVLTGADFTAQCAGRPVEVGRVFSAKAGDKLTFMRKRFGMRTYLARAGGFGQPKWLHSNCPTPFGSVQIETNTRWVLPKLDELHVPFRKVSPFVLTFNQKKVVRFLARPEYLAYLSRDKKIVGKVQPNSNRMGMYIQPENPALFGRLNEQLSGPVVMGSIQIVPSGNWVILMADHQTTGGYPILGEIISADLPILAQTELNAEIYFEQVSWEEAVEARRKQTVFLQKIKVGIEFPTLSF
jgi:antagonist of KipI